jgi:ribosomal protein S12
MSTQLICDGCGVVLFVVGERSVGTSVLEAKELIVRGERANDLMGGDLPSGEFHWCMRCAKIAFSAIKDARLRTAGWTK